MAYRRRPHRAAAALLIALALLATAGCGGEESPAAGHEPLTVAEALKADADGPVTVRGTLFADAQGVRLCSAILESHPPQCGQPALRVRGLDFVGESNMQQAKGVRWTNREATLTGKVENDVLTVASG